MATTVFKNNATSNLRFDTGASSISLTITSGDGDKFPELTSDQYFMVTVEDRRTGQLEICRCTSRVADVLTVERAQEGTIAQDFLFGATVSNRLTAGFLQLLIELIEAGSVSNTRMLFEVPNTDDTNQYHQWGPVHVTNTGQMVIGANGYAHKVRNNPGIILFINDHNASNLGSRVPLQAMLGTDEHAVSNQAAVEPFIFYRSRTGNDTIQAELASGADLTSTPVLPGDAITLLQFQGDDGFGTGNPVTVNVLGRVALGVTVAQNRVPGEFLISTMNDTTGTVKTDVTIGQQKVSLGTSKLAIGGIGATVLAPNAINANKADATLATATIDNLVLANALTAPNAGAGELGGYQPIEGPSTNLLLMSQRFAVAPWVLTNATVAASAIQDPFGGGAAAKRITTTAAGGKDLQNGITVPADNANYTASIYWHSSSAGPQVTLRMTFVGGTAYSLIYNPGTTGGFSVTSGAVGRVTRRYQTPDGGYWYRLELTASNAGQTEIRYEIYPNGTAGAASSAEVSDAQVEAGSKATGHIVTTTVPASRTLGSANYETLTLTALPVAANEAAAVIAGLATGTIYQTATGELRIKL